MPYDLRAVFSGPCAYVPNQVPSTVGQATTWSVILPNLRAGWSNATQRVDRHYAVIQYDPAVWTASENPDVELAINGTESRKACLFWLEATQVTFLLPGAPTFEAKLVPVENETKRNPVKIESLSPNQLASLVWLPFLEHLENRFGWFGLENEAYFDSAGLPEPAGHVTAHVLLRHGTLGTHELDRATVGQRLATIWDFRDPKMTTPAERFVQAVALSIALEANALQRPPQVILKQPHRTITLLPVRAGAVSLEIKNRELEELLGLPSEIDELAVDRDFRFLYNEDQRGLESETRYPLPHFLPTDDGVGGEGATCGGSGSKGFAERFKATIDQWK